MNGNGCEIGGGLYEWLSGIEQEVVVMVLGRVVECRVERSGMKFGKCECGKGGILGICV